MTQGNNSGGAGAWAGGIPGVPAAAGRFQPYILEPGSPNAYTCFGSWEPGARSCIPIEEADDPLDGCSQSGECRRFTLEQNPPTTRFPVSPRRDGRFEIQQFRDFIREHDTYNMAIDPGRIVVTFPGNRSVPKAKRFFLNVKNLEEAELDVNLEFELIVTAERMILRQAGAFTPSGVVRGRPIEEDPEARRLRIAARLRKAAGEAARSSDGLGDDLELEIDIDFDDDVEIDDELDDEEEIEIDLSGDDAAEVVDDDPDAVVDGGVDDIAGLDDFDDGDLDGLEGLEGDDDEGDDDETPVAPANGDEAAPPAKVKKKGDGKKGEGKSSKSEGKSAKSSSGKKVKASADAEPAAAPAAKKKSAEPAAKVTEEVEAPVAKKKKSAEKDAPVKKAAEKKAAAEDAPVKKAADKKAAAEDAPVKKAAADSPKKKSAEVAKKAEPEAPAAKAKASDAKKAAAAPAKADKKKR